MGFALGVLGLVAFVRVEHRRRLPTLELAYFRAHAFSGLGALVSCQLNTDLTWRL